MVHVDVRASLEEAEQDVDLLEVKLEKVTYFIMKNVGLLLWYCVMVMYVMYDLTEA